MRSKYYKIKNLNEHKYISDNYFRLDFRGVLLLQITIKKYYFIGLFKKKFVPSHVKNIIIFALTPLEILKFWHTP